MSKAGRQQGHPRAKTRREVGLAGSVVTIHGSQPVFVENLSPGGAKLIGRRLPAPGEQILLRANELAMLGRIAWAVEDFRGVEFDEDEGPSAGLCIGLHLRRGS